MFRSNVRRTNRGVSLVLFGIFLIVLLGFCGLTIDVGHWYHVKARLQGNADAAALAGALKLPAMQAAVTEARKYADLNFVTPAEVIKCQPVPADPGRQFEIELAREAGPFFSSVLGVGRVTISVRSVAESAVQGQQVQGTAQGTGAFSKALLAGREFQPQGAKPPPEALVLSGSIININGPVHTNGELRVTGSDNRITGQTTAGHTVAVGGQNNFSGSAPSTTPLESAAIPNSNTIPVPTVDTSKLSSQAKAAGTYFRFTGPGAGTGFERFVDGTFQPVTDAQLQALFPGATFSADKIHFAGQALTLNGTLYVENGGVQLNGSNLTGTGTVVADGEIGVSGSSISHTSTNSLGFVSLSQSQSAITISGSNSTFVGAFFAPNGGTNLNGSGLTINGSVTSAFFQNISGSNITINFDGTQASKIPITALEQTFVRLVE